MEKSDLVIVGGSAAGVRAAITAQRLAEVEKVTVIRKEQRVLIPCGIPYIFGTIGSVDKNMIPDAILGKAGLIIDEVTSIDREARTVATSGGETIGYQKLMLATGSQAVFPPIPGRELDNVFTVRKDADYLEKLLGALKGAKDVVIVGGGFIGVEMGDECHKMGKDVTIVELLPHCLMLNCDEEFCVRAEEKLKERGMKVITGDSVAAIAGNGKVDHVELSSGEKVKADLVIVAIGTAPSTELAKNAGLEIGKQRGIKVDPYMRTDDPDIFAIGDCAEKFSFFTGKPSALRLASIACTEATIAAANLFKNRRKYEGPIGVFGTIIGDMAISVAGLTERAAEEAGFEFFTGEATSPDRHPGSMPDTNQLQTKLLFEKGTGKLLGGELCGGRSAGEIGNILGSLIRSRATIEDIVTLQFGTHPALTASPVIYPLVSAAEQALTKI